MPCTYTYDLSTGFISGRVNSFIPESQLPNDGQGLYRVPDIKNEDGTRTIVYPEFGNIIDITQNPPILIPDPDL